MQLVKASPYVSTSSWRQAWPRGHGRYSKIRVSKVRYLDTLQLCVSNDAPDARGHIASVDDDRFGQNPV